MYRALRVARPTLLASAVLVAGGLGCGDRRSDGSPVPSSTAVAPVPTSSAAPGPASPFSVVLESKGPLVLSGIEGGVVVADVAHTHLGRTARGEMVAEPMPAGLPDGPGRLLHAAGRMSGGAWFVYEKLREDGKVEANPLFRLGKEGWKQFADDWKPAIAPWSKHRILAASTSSGRLKIKVLEPSLPSPPADLPSPRLSDVSCEQTLKVDALAALGSGEVFAAGTCKPDTAAGAGASATRYVVVRWPPASSVRAGAVDGDAGAAPVAAVDAGSRDAGASDGGMAGGSPRRGPPATLVPTITRASSTSSPVSPPTSSTKLSTPRAPPTCGPRRVDPAGKPAGGADASSTAAAGASKLFHFDGATWGAVALPPATAIVRGLAATADGTLWMVTERAIFSRSPAGVWQGVSPPASGAEPGATWEMLAVSAPDGGDVWIAARRTAPSGIRDVVLRTRPASPILRWE